MLQSEIAIDLHCKVAARNYTLNEHKRIKNDSVKQFWFGHKMEVYEKNYFEWWRKTGES